MVVIVPSTKFKKSVRHLDAISRERLEKAIHRILSQPDIGKPLRYTRGERSLRLSPFRIVYSFRKDTQTLYLLKFEHRDSVYASK